MKWKNYYKKANANSFEDSFNSIKWSNPLLCVTEDELDRNIEKATKSISSRNKYNRERSEKSYV
jgi:cobalamin biosynthesis Co2+ chelatase CbiK